MRQLFLLLILLVSFSSCKKAELVPDFEDYCGTWVNSERKDQFTISKKTIVYQSVETNVVAKITKAYYLEGNSEVLVIEVKKKHYDLFNGRYLDFSLNADKNTLSVGGDNYQKK